MKNVFTDGVFDLFHANHAAFLEEARGLGDRLIVAVISDRRVAEYKRWPVISERDRLDIIRRLRCVDKAFILDEPLNGETMAKIIEAHDISAVVYAGNATPDFYRPAEAAGIMHRLPYREGINTTAIIESIVSRRRDGDL